MRSCLTGGLIAVKRFGSEDKLLTPFLATVVELLGCIICRVETNGMVKRFDFILDKVDLGNVSRSFYCNMHG
jgi:hypothetical protein